MLPPPLAHPPTHTLAALAHPTRTHPRSPPTPPAHAQGACDSELLNNAACAEALPPAAAAAALALLPGVAA